jgi:phosphatidylglycerophosphatase A
MKKAIAPSPIKNPVARTAVLGLSTGLGLGYAPVAPGTFGSLLGIPLGLLLLQYPRGFQFLF